ncbi:MAG: DUF4186 domain-containing protein [Phycisphaerae bacterium]
MKADPRDHENPLAGDAAVRTINQVLVALRHSRFRQCFHLGPRERAYVDLKGLDTLAGHARRFIRERLAAARPRNDGRQTPKRGHPVFVAQHATATCCRGCLAKWHGIPAGRPLTEGQITYVCNVIAMWLRREHDAAAAEPGLFDEREGARSW